MAILFEVKDPRGVVVSCTEERWNKHVLFKHKHLKFTVDDVKQAIHDPLWISEDAVNAQVHIYYRHPRNRYAYIKVAVRLSSKSKGALVTAYPCSKGKPGEKMIWPKSKN